MTIFIATKFELFEKEEFCAAAKSENELMKKLRNEFPYLRGTLKDNNLATDNTKKTMLRVFEYEL